MTSPTPDYPEGYEAWPPSVQERWLQEYNALCYPPLDDNDKPS